MYNNQFLNNIDLDYTERSNTDEYSYLCMDDYNRYKDFIQ